MQVGRRPLLFKYGRNLKYFCRFVAGWVKECMLTWAIVGCTFISMMHIRRCQLLIYNKGLLEDSFFLEYDAASWGKRFLAFPMSVVLSSFGSCTALQLISPLLWDMTYHCVLYQRFRRYSLLIEGSKHLWTREHEGSTFIRNAGNSTYNDAASELTPEAVLCWCFCARHWMAEEGLRGGGHFILYLG